MKPRPDTRRSLLNTTLDLIWSQSYGSIGVDEICKRAGVQKGSFYHFFPSKSDLAIEAIEVYWTEQRRPQLEEAFQAEGSIEEKFSRYCDQVYYTQRERYAKMGKVGGCPFSCLGAELSTQDDKIQKKCQELASRIRAFFEDALAASAGVGRSHRSISAKSQELYALVTGMLFQARIQNNLVLVKGLKPSLLRLLAAEELAA